jgi:2-polyprenyl-3-methyl-5-hydroxy-6-metoxy-1,4-benzoquinol methylase
LTKAMDYTRKVISIFDKNAQVYQEKFMDVRLYQQSLDLFCSGIEKKGATVLELACGPGNITRYLLDKRPDFKILATDLSSNMLELARVNCPEAEFSVMDCRDIAKLEERYDGIVCGFILPYLAKEETLKLIADCAERLQPGGMLYLSTMEDDYEKSGIQQSSQGDEVYMYYHEAGYLTDSLKKNGFIIVDVQRKDTSTTENLRRT